MTDLLRVLHVEDSDVDAKLIAHALRRGYRGLRIERVADADAMRAALTAEPWDVIVSDWALPTFSGLGALRLTKELGLDVPFLIVSGTIGEEAAVDAMREGAHDYLLKDRLTRLVPAVERAIGDGRLRAELRHRRVQAEEEAQRVRDELERRVAQRTDDLHVANERLSGELTERTRAEEALTLAKHAAVSANLAKSVFLANMSHEIRTPMNAILGYAQLLQRDAGLSPEQRQSLEIIQRAGDHLLDLINDVLEMSKIEAGHRKLVERDVDLVTLLEDLTSMFRLRADDEHLAFAIHISADVPRFIVSDEGKLRQVLVNLLGNAMKFTREGGVSVRLRVRPAAGADRLIVEIEDTGPGIALGEIQELFHPFAQAPLGARARGGTGLGLAISRDFAHLLGGDITVESRVGEGSVFTFDIPIKPCDTPSKRPSVTHRGRVIGIAGSPASLRIVLADDDEDSRSWLARLLTQVGFQVHTAVDGVEAIAQVEQWQPHLVLMDMNMPRLDGYEAMRRIRALPLAPRPAIVAVTAVAFDDAREAIFAAGADGWLRKPCREADILEEIARHLKVAYRYAPNLPRSTLGRRSLPPGPGAAALPLDFCARIREAAQIADYQGLNDLIRTLPPEYARVSDELQLVVDRFAYDELELVLSARPAARA
jgi:two-component system sensor histidine kinase/response regulator